MKTSPCFAFVLLLAGLSLAQAQDGTSRTIAATATLAPGLGGNFISFSTPVLNGSGVVCFQGFTDGPDAIFKTSGTGLVTIASTLQTAPGLSANFSIFSNPILNESGTVAFVGTTQALTTAIYTGSAGALTTIATSLQTLPGVLGTVPAFLSNMGLSDSGSVAFSATTTLGTTTGSGEYFGSGASLTTIATTAQTAPGTGALFGSPSAPVLNNTGSAAFVEQNGSIMGLYMAFDSTLTTVATTLQAAPEIGGNFSSFATFALNDNGAVAFNGSNSSGRGIFARVGGVLSAIASTARQAPGFAGNFTAFSDSALSNAGIVAFRGQTGVVDKPSFGQGIYTGTGGALRTIAITGQSAPGVGGTFSSFGKPAVNDLGTTAFLGSASGGSGIYLGDGQQLITVAFTGQSLAGSTVTSVVFAGGNDRGGSGQFNNNGQLAYNAWLANGTTTIQLFTPTLHFRSATGGAWTTRSNWTLGLLPASVHDVVIDPTAALTISGPMLPTTVKSLAIGSGANVAELTLQSTGTLTAAGGASTGVSGRLSGNGRLNANLLSAGTIAPGLVSAAGSISVTGDVTLQSTSHLAFDLGGLARKTNYDFLGVTGLLTLGGRLDVSLLGGFVPQGGTTFDLFDATTVAGNFSTVNLPAVTGPFRWLTGSLPTTGVISVFSGSAKWAASAPAAWSSGSNANWNDTAGAAVHAAPGTFAGFSTVDTAVFDATSGTLANLDGAAPSLAAVNFTAGSHAIARGTGGTLTLNGGASPATVTDSGGSDSITAPVQLASNAIVAVTSAADTLTLSGGLTGLGKTLTKTGAGKLVLSGAQNYAVLNLDGGTTDITGSFTGSAATVHANAATKFTTSQTLAALFIGDGVEVTFGDRAGAAFDDGGGKADLALVPEPGSASLLLLGALGILSRRRRAVR